MVDVSSTLLDVIFAGLYFTCPFFCEKRLTALLLLKHMVEFHGLLPTNKESWAAILIVNRSLLSHRQLL